MKMLTPHSFVLVTILLSTGFMASAQSATTNTKSAGTNELKTYVIEREIPGAGKLTPAELKSISQTSCTVLKEMGPKIQWIQSYVTGNKIYCVYKAENAELVREHARKGNFPANEVNEVTTMISPETAR